MKKILFILSAIITSILFFACSKHELPTTPPESPALSITPTLSTISPLTRAAISAFPNGAELGIFVTSGTIGNNYNNISSNANVKSTLNGGAWGQTPDVYLSPAAATIFAYYPFSAVAVNPAAIPVETATQTDYLYGTHSTGQPVINSGNPSANLTMNHALSLVQFRLNTLNYTGAGLLTKIEIANKTGKTMLFSAGTLNCATGVITNTSGRNQSAVLNTSYTLPQILSTNPADYQKVLVIPVTATAAAGDIQITFTIDGKNFTYDVPTATKWEKGKVNTYTVTLSGRGIIINNIVITDWVEGANGSVSLT